MATMDDVTNAFLEVCETGQGWEACRPYCTPDATFSSQAEPIAHVTALADYAEWMKGLYITLPDAAYDVTALAVDPARNIAIAAAVFTGTHTGEGGPVPPTGQRAESDYVYIMRFDGDRIAHVTKVWHAGWAMKQLGWA